MKKSTLSQFFSGAYFTSPVLKSALLFLLTTVLWYGDLSGQTLTADHIDGQPDNVVALHLDSLPSLVPLNEQDPIAPFYWFFNVYDNGEYSPIMIRKNEDGTVRHCWQNYPHYILDKDGEDKAPGFEIPTGFRGTDTTFNYTYPGVNSDTDSLSYNPRVFIIDRKGDPTDPIFDTASARVSVNNLQSGGPIVKTIPDRGSIYLAHSHGFLDDPLSAFIVSYKPCLDTGGRVHLFFGCKRTGGPDSPFVKAIHLRNPVTILPNYGTSAEFLPDTGPWAPTSMFSVHRVLAFGPEYTKEVREAHNDLSSEFRFFELARFQNYIKENPPIDLKTGEWSYALAVLTSDSDQCTPSLTTSNYEKTRKIRLILGKAFPDLIDSNRYIPDQLMLDGKHIVDVDTIYLRSGEPTDPNNIVIEQVCNQDSSVLLKLTFCNAKKATGNATGTIVDFDVIDTLFEWCHLAPEDVTYPKYKRHKKFKRTCLPVKKAKKKCPFKRINYNCKNHKVYLERDLYPGDCSTIKVVLKPKPGEDFGPHGIVDYLTTHPILSAKVSFEPTDVSITVQNELISKYFKRSDCKQLICPTCPCK